MVFFILLLWWWGTYFFFRKKKENKFRKIGFQCVFMVLCLVTYFWGLSSLFVPFFNFFVEHRLTSIFYLSFSLFCLQLQSRNSGMSRWMDFLGENRKGESKIIWKSQKWSPKDKTTLSHLKISIFSLLYYSLLKIKFAIEKQLCIFVSIAVVKIDSWNEGSVD